MSIFLRIDINLAAMILLGIVFLIAFKYLDVQENMNRIFLNTSMIVFVEILFETLTCIINRRPEAWLIPVSTALHVGVFATAPVLTYFWYTFIHTWASPQDPILRKKHMLLIIPVLFNGVLTLLSPAYHFVFYISKSNVYHRGPLFFVFSIITYFYLAYSILLILKQRKKLVRQDFWPMFIVGILPTVGGLLQTLFYGVLLMWSSTAFSLVIVYIFLQQRMIHLDHLTGAWTRGSFDYYISQRTEEQCADSFGVIFIDIDGLKQINDEYGHLEGDVAIQSSVRLIRKALKKTDIIARYGGDEFVVVLDCQSHIVLSEVIQAINLNFIQYNSRFQKPYKLECSTGADLFNPNESRVEEFLNNVDQLMYRNKKMKKHRQTDNEQGGVNQSLQG